MQVLLVDDQPLMHELMPPVLRRAFGDDVEVVSVSDLEAAFQRLAHHKAPELALLDLGLPGHAGVDTLRRFRWKFSGVPVIVVSATEDAATVRVARGMGVAGYLPKTLKPDDMVTALRQVAGGGSWFPEAGSHGR
jgi:DNA-binding NarL/FixJ family response regulator